MDSDHEFWSRIDDYAQGRLSLDGLQEWLAVHVQDLTDSPQDSLSVRANQTWALLSEYSYGHRTDAELRRILGNWAMVRAAMTSALPNRTSP